MRACARVILLAYMLGRPPRGRAGMHQVHGPLQARMQHSCHAGFWRRGLRQLR